MFLNLFANGVTTAETTLFPIGSTRHTVFCVIVSIFFVLQFLRTKRWYQLIMAVAVAFSMIVYIAPENKTLFYTVGIIELILLLAALVVGIVQGRKIAKAEKAAEEAKKAAEEAAAQTAETVQAQAEAVTEAAAEQTDAAAETVSEAAEETAQTVTEAVQETAGAVTETVTKAAEQTEQTVTEAVQETAETAAEAVKETAEQIASEAENHAE
jgi:DNA anti-recombination protein RmuC